VRRPAAVLAAVALGLAACSSPPPATQVIGKGPERVTIRRPPHADGTTVLFLHGWGAPGIGFYRPWIEHLVDEGHVVVYPRYQDSFASLPSLALPNALKGIRAAFAELDVRRLVVVGHSAGGALAADYAAIARTARLPVPEAIMPVYPGRSLPGVAPTLPELGDERIPHSVRIVALASRGDGVVGTRTAREIVRDAGHGRVLVIDQPGATDHRAPQRASAVERQVFWTRLDALLAPRRPSP
jgi:acetyl esterase/lipase